MTYVWIFHGAGGRFASGVFTSRAKAEAWITQQSLSGLLTKYPLDTGVFDWAVETGTTNLREGHPITPELIQTFTTASQEHCHYEDGQEA